MSIPVSIRTKNPGAMWPCAIATHFGSTQCEQLNDAQRNKAAIFPTFEQGGAAQFALWAKKYSDMRLSAAIYMWSGHNSSPAYAAFLVTHVPGLSMNVVLTREFFTSELGRKFMAAQAQWEAGQPYPMTDAQWIKAQQLAFGTAKPVVPIPPPPDIPKPEPVPQPAPSGGFFVSLVNFILSLLKRK